MLVSGIYQKYWLRDWTNFPSRRQARDICLVSKPVFFGKYHLQAWYISIIPPNKWLSLPEDKSREHRNVKYYYF